MSLRRRIGSVLRRAVASGPGAGALSLSCLFGLDFVGATFEFMGFSGDDQAYSLILHRYGARIAANQLQVLATYALVGALFGCVGAAIGWEWDRLRGRVAATWRRTARGAVAAAVGHAYFFARSLVRDPQLYSEAFYDRGGVRRALMVMVTDHVSTRALDAVMILTLVIAVGLPLARPAARAQLRAWQAKLRRPEGRRSQAAIAAALVLLVVVTAGLSTTQRPPKGPTDRPNILLLAVDSLRADRVFAPDAATRFPALASLAARGVRFREAHVTVPRTFPSFVTLLTGRWPHHHGIRHMFPTAAQRRAIGPALPEALRKSGYATAVVSDYAGEIFSRTPLGFSDVQVPYFDMKTIVAQRGLQVHPNVLPYAATRLGRVAFPAMEAFAEHSDPELLAERAMAKLDRIGGQPFFMTVFFSTAHFPYASPAPYYRRFADPHYDGPFRYQKPPLSTAPVGPADAAQIRALYDGAVASTDAAIARILRRLDEDGLRERTIVVLLADHGENLYDVDGRGMGHGDHLRGSAADHVPLVIVDPVHAPAARDVTGIVRDVDLAPTLAALSGVAPPASDGVSLLPLLRGERETLDLDAFSETEFWFTANGPGFEPDERLPYPGITGVTDLADDDDVFLKPVWQDTVVVAKHRAVRTPGWKLLYRPTRRGALLSLYDVQHDPEERVDVAAAHPEVVAQLKAKLEAWMTSDGRTVMRGGFAVPR